MQFVTLIVEIRKMSGVYGPLIGMEMPTISDYEDLASSDIRNDGNVHCCIGDSLTVY